VKGNSFRTLLIQLDIVERADRIPVAELEVLGELEALEAFEFAEVGAAGSLEAEAAALEEDGLFLGAGRTEGGPAPPMLAMTWFSSFRQRCMFQAGSRGGGGRGSRTRDGRRR